MTDLYAQIQSAANAGAFGINGYAQPTAEQCRAGNYRKGRLKLYGLDIAIETPQGQRRIGKSDGRPWSVICMAHYGDISGTRGADGDPVDCYIGPTPESNRVFVVNQNGKDGAFDEHKVMLAFADEDTARSAYLGSYERGWTGLGSIVSATVNQFKWWLKYGDTRKPFTKNALPYDGDDDMNEITWDSAAMPANSDLATILYGLRANDRDGLLLDAVQMADILEDADGRGVLDALVVENAKLQAKMEQLQRIMEASGDTVKPVSLQISEPFKQKGTTHITALFELSDGQTVAIFFHNPDSTPNTILPQDELVSWKWLLNKQDVTIVVAPEKGRDLNPREVARRIMRLAEKNSAKFQKANANRAERLASIEQAKQQVAEKESTLAALDIEIADLTAKVEARRATQAPQPGSEQGATAGDDLTPEQRAWAERTLRDQDHLPWEEVEKAKAMLGMPPDEESELLKTPEGRAELARRIRGEKSGAGTSFTEIARRLIPAEFKTTSMSEGDIRAMAEDGIGIRFTMGVRGKSISGYVLDERGQDSLGSSAVLESLERSIGLKLETALMVIERKRRTRRDAAAASRVELGSNEEIRALGVATITDVGGENVYVERDGKQYFFKPLNTDVYSVGEHDFSGDKTFAVEPEPASEDLGYPVDMKPSADEIVRNYSLTTIQFNGAPISRDVVNASIRQAFSELADADAREKVRVTLEASRDKAKEALYSKAYELYRERVNGAPLSGEAQLKAFVTNGALDLSAQAWAEDFYRLYKINPGKISRPQAEGLSPAGAANLARFVGGDFSMQGDATQEASQAYAEAAKAFLEGDLNAPVPKKRDALLDTEFLSNLQPKPLDKAVRAAKTPKDQFTAAYDMASDDKEPRFYLRGVHTEPENGLIVSTDGHRMMVVSEMDLSHLPAKPQGLEGFTVLGRDGKWIDGKFPDWRRVMPKNVRASDLGQFTAKRVAAYARAITKASRYISRSHVRPIKIQVGDRYTFVVANYLMDLAVAFQKYGYATFKMGMEDGASGQKMLYAESADGKVRQVVMPVRTGDEGSLFAPLLPDGQEPEQSPNPATVQPPAADPAQGASATATTPGEDSNIGRKWMNGLGEEIEIESLKDGRYYTLKNGKVGGAPIIPAGELEQTIALDQRQYQDMLDRQQRVAQEEAAEAAAKAQREDTDGFAEQFPQVQRDRIRSTLAKSYNTPKGVMSLRDFVRQLVAEGRVVSEWDGERVLMDPKTKDFQGQKQITKTGMDYAAYLIARRPAVTNEGDEQMQAARALLQSVIDGAADMDEALADRLQAIHDQYEGNAEIMALFEKAANAFSDAMIARAKAALAA